jgi:RNA polymerase sigma-70 factor (ECF subfamily)
MAAGERDAHGELYERHGRAVFAYLAGRLADRGVAEEVFQECMLEAWHSSGRFRGDSRVLTWLLAIAHYQSSNHLRRHRRQESADPSLLERRNGTSPSLATVDLRIDLQNAVGELPPAQQAVLELVFFHGLTVEEVAEVLDVAPGTVKSRLFRAKAALKPRLSSETPNV